MPKITKQFIWENKNAINALTEQMELIHRYVIAKRDHSDEEKKYERLLALNAPKINQIFIDAGMMPTMHWGSQAYGYQERSITQDIPYYTRLWLGEDNLFGARSMSSDLNIIDSIINHYLGLLGIYKDCTRRSWVNTFNPLTYISLLLSLPAKTLRFVLESVFDTSLPKNFVTQGISGVINLATWWITIVAPFIDKIGGTEKMIEELRKLF